MRRYKHAQSSFQMSALNDQVRTLRNEIAPYHVKTTFHVEHVRGHR